MTMSTEIDIKPEKWDQLILWASQTAPVLEDQTSRTHKNQATSEPLAGRGT